MTLREAIQLAVGPQQCQPEGLSIYGAARLATTWHVLMRTDTPIPINIRLVTPCVQACNTERPEDIHASN